jgi:hypothetical protein
MTDKLRTSLLALCAFCRVTMDAADAELRGGPSEPRVEAMEQLGAAMDDAWITDGDAPRFMRPVEDLG